MYTPNGLNHIAIQLNLEAILRSRWANIKCMCVCVRVMYFLNVPSFPSYFAIGAWVQHSRM